MHISLILLDLQFSTYHIGTVGKGTTFNLWYFMIQKLSEMEQGYSLPEDPITLYEQSHYSQKPNILIPCEQECPQQRSLYGRTDAHKFFFYPPNCCNMSEDVQQSCWQSLLMACRRYIQRHISCLSSITIDWLWSLGNLQSTSYNLVAGSAG